MRTTILILFLSLNLFAQSIDFYKEDITFKLNKTKFYISGLYHFKNTSDKLQKSLIYFPVIPTCITNKADSINIINLSNLQHVPYNRKTSGFTFLLESKANDSTIYQIEYEQDICGDSALYILESTQKWVKPLRSGIYKLIVPDSLEIEFLSYEPDSIYSFTNYKIYYLYKINFFPDRNLVFKIKSD